MAFVQLQPTIAPRPRRVRSRGRGGGSQDALLLAIAEAFGNNQQFNQQSDLFSQQAAANQEFLNTQLSANAAQAAEDRKQQSDLFNRQSIQDDKRASEAKVSADSDRAIAAESARLRHEEVLKQLEISGQASTAQVEALRVQTRSIEENIRMGRAQADRGTIEAFSRAEALKTADPGQAAIQVARDQLTSGPQVAQAGIHGNQAFNLLEGFGSGDIGFDRLVEGLQGAETELGDALLRGGELKSSAAADELLGLAANFQTFADNNQADPGFFSSTKTRQSHELGKSLAKRAAAIRRNLETHKAKTDAGKIRLQGGDLITAQAQSDFDRAASSIAQSFQGTAGVPGAVQKQINRVRAPQFGPGPNNAINFARPTEVRSSFVGPPTALSQPTSPFGVNAPASTSLGLDPAAAVDQDVLRQMVEIGIIPAFGP